VHRVRHIELTDQCFTVRAGFDARRWEAEAFGIVHERPITVVLRFRADQAPYVRERVWHPTQRIRELHDGRVELTLRIGGIFEATRWILGWGDAVEVLRPQKLRADVVALWRRAATAVR
jgi:predicted DNA-binding transcriptional regulator YafY